MGKSSLKASALNAKLNFATSGGSVAGGVLVVLYLLPVFQFTEQQLRFLLVVCAAYTIPLGIVSALLQRRWLRSMLQYLEHCETNGSAVSDEMIHEAFAGTVDLPRKLFLYNVACFFVGALLIGPGMALFFESIAMFSAWLMFVGALCAGSITQCFVFVVLKSILEPLRNHLAQKITDPEIRQRLVRPVSLPKQLFVVLASIAFATTFFALLLAQGRGESALEETAIRSERSILQSAVDALRGGAPLKTTLATMRAAYEPLGYRLLVLDAQATTVLDGDAGLLLKEEFESLRSVEAKATDEKVDEKRNSLWFGSPNAFLWGRLPGTEQILVVLSPPNATGLAQMRSPIFLLAIVAAVVCVAVLLASFVSQDLSRALTFLRNSIHQISDGNLTQSALLESENEIGELARAMDAMRISLHETVNAILLVSEEVNQATSEAVSATSQIASGSRAQSDGVKQVHESVDLLTDRVERLDETALGLAENVERSASAVSQLKSVGVGLTTSAEDLSVKAEQTSLSIEQMNQAYHRVVESTAQLSASIEAAVLRIDAMATQVRDVESNAGETEALSNRMLTAAEQGYERVQETIRGMETISQATQAAENVVSNLVVRVGSIGSVVDVIDDVADETGLLALNAAIIAAQAGEYGRGFAVVADEIRDLAERVTASTKEISAVIKALQAESDKAAGVIRAGAKNVQEGVVLAAQAGASLEEITQSARVSGDRVRQIATLVQAHARTSHEVVDLISGVRDGVTQISFVTHEQEQGGVVVLNSAVDVDAIAHQVEETAKQQSESAEQIAESVVEVRSMIHALKLSLGEQLDECRKMAVFFEAVREQADANQDAATSTEELMRNLVSRFNVLRMSLQKRFRVQ